MKTPKETFRYFFTPFWLGFALSAFLGVNFMDWEFWATVLPVFVVDTFMKESEDDQTRDD